MELRGIADLLQVVELLRELVLADVDRRGNSFEIRLAVFGLVEYALLVPTHILLDMEGREHCPRCLVLCICCLLLEIPQSRKEHRSDNSLALLLKD